MVTGTNPKESVPPIWLVGHDLTHAADEVTRAAAAELAPHRGTLIIFHAYQVPVAPPVYAGAAISVPPLNLELEKQVERMAISRLDELRRDITTSFPEIQVHTRVAQGPAAATLLSFADLEHVDRIVVGTHGRTGFRHFLLGSVAERVVRLASVPVLVNKQNGGHIHA